MTSRQIERANLEAAATRWVQYVNEAQTKGDAKRIAYGEIRLANAMKRITAFHRA